MAASSSTTSTISRPSRSSPVRLRVAPLVLDLCNQKDITRGLQGKFSVYHGAAIGLVRGRGGLAEFTDEAVNDRRSAACARRRPRRLIHRSAKINPRSTCS
jgi:hypothetical protein